MLVTVPFALGAEGVQHTARGDRLALGAMWLPGSAVGARSGILHGPAGTVGATTLTSQAVLTVDPFRAVLQSPIADALGAYLATNDAPVAIPVPARHATQFRRALVAVWVADSDASGTASNFDNDRTHLEPVLGALAATGAATVTPATPAGGIAFGYFLIPPVTDGGAITWTPIPPPPTALRGQPLLVDNAAARTALGNVFAGLDVIEADTRRRYFHTGAGWAKFSTTDEVVYFATQAARLAFGAGAFDGQIGIELDNDRVLYWTGAGWRYVGDHLLVLNAAARDAIAGPYPGLEVRLNDTLVAYYFTGSAWVVAVPVAAGPLGVVATGTTAALSVTLSPGRVYAVHGKADFSQSIPGSSTGSSYQASTAVTVTGSATTSLGTYSSSYGNGGTGTGGLYSDTIVVDEPFQVATARSYSVSLTSGQTKIRVEDLGAVSATSAPPTVM